MQVRRFVPICPVLRRVERLVPTQRTCGSGFWQRLRRRQPLPSGPRWGARRCKALVRAWRQDGRRGQARWAAILSPRCRETLRRRCAGCWTGPSPDPDTVPGHLGRDVRSVGPLVRRASGTAAHGLELDQSACCVRPSRTVKTWHADPVAGVGGISLERLAFLDERGALTNMACMGRRRVASAPRARCPGHGARGPLAAHHHIGRARRRGVIRRAWTRR